MKKMILTIIAIAMISLTFGQDNPRPTKSRFWKSKESTFSIKAGDILVYKVEGEQKEVIVSVKKFGPSIQYHYGPNVKSHTGNVSIQADAINNGNKYNSPFSSNKGSFWISKSNYRQLASGEAATMDFGNGANEYTRGNTGTVKINYKGKQKIVTVYNIIEQTEGKRMLSILTNEENPLIIIMEGGSKMTLQEVR